MELKVDETKQNYPNSSKIELEAKDVKDTNEVKDDLLLSLKQKMKSVLSKMLKKKKVHKLHDYLFVKNPPLGRFYVLPKIHKLMKNVPGRPIISNNTTTTHI